MTDTEEQPIFLAMLDDLDLEELLIAAHMDVAAADGKSADELRDDLRRRMTGNEVLSQQVAPDESAPQEPAQAHQARQMKFLWLGRLGMVMGRVMIVVSCFIYLAMVVILVTCLGGWFCGSPDTGL